MSTRITMVETLDVHRAFCLDPPLYVRSARIRCPWGNAKKVSAARCGTIDRNTALYVFPRADRNRKRTTGQRRAEGTLRHFPGPQTSASFHSTAERPEGLARAEFTTMLLRRPISTRCRNK